MDCSDIKEEEEEEVWKYVHLVKDKFQGTDFYSGLSILF
jgi:hypothetical protein